VKCGGGRGKVEVEDGDGDVYIYEGSSEVSDCIYG
jgi:hypothetical protein